uniref:GST N-terminal domain-containing protein n=1 Tax=Ananas comosus var. bracteatus TaxID=296719 RepID=A0A6V7PVQ5_ANACO|nr:unnamed protein product [Ananas comosus var. bracteatus]
MYANLSVPHPYTWIKHTKVRIQSHTATFFFSQTLPIRIQFLFLPRSPAIAAGEISGDHHAGSEGTGAAAEPRHSLPQHTTSTAAVKSAAVHLLFGLYILSTAVASDLSQAAADCFRPSTFNFATAEQEGKGGRLSFSPTRRSRRSSSSTASSASAKGLLYFAGAEKKDHRVLVPDLGSLTSVHDRLVDSSRFNLTVSGNTLIVRLDYEYKAVNLLKGEQSNPEFEKINPIKYVPALVDGDVVVADSFAIILIWQYLEDKYPQNPLLPQDLKKKALNLQVFSLFRIFLYCNTLRKILVLRKNFHGFNFISTKASRLWRNCWLVLPENMLQEMKSYW